MKIALICESLDAWRGGAETSTLQFLHHLMDRGVEVHVFTRSRLASAPGLHVHVVKASRIGRARRSGSFVRNVESLLQHDEFDIVHAISMCPCADIYQPRGGTVAETIARNIALRRSPAAQSLKRYSSRLNLRQRRVLAQERKLFGDPCGPTVVAISQYVVRQLQEHYQLPDSRIRVIYNGVDADDSTLEQRLTERAQIRAEYGIHERDLLLLQVAHNFRLKGVRTWMEALAILLRAGTGGIRSLVIGRGDTHRWHKLAEKLGIANELIFVGSTSRMRHFYHAADVLVHPTHYDPCSRVVLEGMVSGLPCVTTRWDGAAEMIQHGVNGFVLEDASDARTLAEIVRTLQDRSMRERIGDAAGKLREHVSMARHANEMLELYYELAGEKSVR